MGAAKYTIKDLLESIKQLASQNNVVLLCFEYAHYEGREDSEIDRLISIGEGFVDFSKCSSQAVLSFILGDKLFCWRNGKDEYDNIWLFSKLGEYAINHSREISKNDTGTWGNATRVINGIIEGSDEAFYSRSCNGILKAIFVIKSEADIAENAENFACKLLKQDPMINLEDNVLSSWVIEQGKKSGLVSQNVIRRAFSRKEIYMLLWVIAFYLLEQVSIDRCEGNTIEQLKQNKEVNSSYAKNYARKLIGNFESDENEQHYLERRQGGRGRLLGITMQRRQRFTLTSEMMEDLKSAKSEQEFNDAVMEVANEMIAQKVPLHIILKNLSHLADAETLIAIATKDRNMMLSMYWVVIMLYCKAQGVFDSSLYYKNLKDKTEEILREIADTGTST